MSDAPIKKRMARAKSKAVDDLRSLGYDVILSDNRPVCLVALRGSDVRIIRICLDAASHDDKFCVSKYAASAYASRELWIRKPAGERFEIHKI